ncbi:aromatic acid/H+ symport family MFS transporter [Salinifilum aidingensis]
MPENNPDQLNAKRQRSTVRWVVLLAAMTLVFDGYDLVVYGTVVPTLLHDPSQLGALTPAQAGALGSYALVGVLVGALTAGAIGDHIGRRRMVLTNVVVFSTGMGITAMATNIAVFGLFRFITGIGVGALVATAGAVVAEFAPAQKRNLLNAVVYSGVPAGGVLASVLAIVVTDAVGWRGLFWIGALPLVTLLPLAWAKLPESPRWLHSRGQVERAREISRKTGVPLPSPAQQPAEDANGGKVGFAALATRRYAWPTFLLGLMSFSGLLLTYGLDTWLPEIMGQYGFGESYSLLFLLVLNLGAIFGSIIASQTADRIGAKQVIATTFGIAALSLCLLALELPLVVLLAGVAIAGFGTIGTQVLVYGLVSNYYGTNARAAGVAWCAGFGRLGGIAGPVLGGVLIGMGLGGQLAFVLFGGIALLGALVTLLVPRNRSGAELAGASPEAAPAPTRS